MFSFVTAQGKLADVVRTRLAPALLGGALALEPVREYLFRTVSQVMVNYRGSALSAGTAGAVHGGDRLPWVAMAPRTITPRSRRSLGRCTSMAVRQSRCARRARRTGIPLQVFPWSALYRSAGLERDALYLLRPDTYVALADRTADPTALERYFSERALRPYATAP